MKKNITAASLLAAKSKGERLAWLTAYDAGSARIAEQAGIDVILVGDSLGMVNLGFDTTIPVTLEHMILHTAAVVRGCNTPWVVCDLPFGSYQQSKEQAFANSAHVLQETACDAVKLEGGAAMAETIAFLSARGIAVVGHIGMTPQSVKKFGSFKQRGKTTTEREQIFADALAVAEAGATALVLECIPDDLSAKITAAIDIPTVGIGAGLSCDAQVLVWHDLLGLSESTPPFVTPYINLREQAASAITAWADDVRSSAFPKKKS
ncbi:MAG: 3-methyl-2-oxobutanoate hydroxymethyltransferase [Zetaproteobacteria bacterium CG2_30_46_52]|nr:MAG: 3-methyl-2-oxobutanoate hydroxymethyltransferase [Zetaproteobacteria bacterium CG2_30_46_52]